MFARLGKTLVIAALVLTTGAHWATLQTIAWTTMFAANLSSESFSESVSQTFDGKHLCPLCKAIAAGKKSEQKKEFNLATLKMEFPPASEKFVLISPSPFSCFSSAPIFSESFLSRPPVPPPRNFFV